MPTTEFRKSSGWFDSHCHLNDIANLDLQLANAARHQIESYIIPGTTAAQWTEALAFQSAQIHLAVGTHPWFVCNPSEEINALELWLKTHQPVAVGEIGLDYFQGKQPRPDQSIQREAFEGQLELAKQYDLPVILHCVKAHNDVLRMLKNLNINCGVVHAFSGSVELAQSYVDQGLHIGVGPMILRSPKTLNAVCQMPIKSLVLETDAPFMATLPITDSNPLLDLLRVAKRLSEHCSLTMDTVQKQTRLNTQRLFRINCNQ